MHENNTKDILCSSINHIMLSLISKKINVLIVGGGGAALIKAKTFVNGGANVRIVAKELLSEFKQLDNCCNLDIINNEYDKKYIYDRHLIVIATNSGIINDRIKRDCEALCKLYIECTKPKEGLCITPCQRNTYSTFFGLHTLEGNPKMSVFLANKVKSNLEKYDGFVEFTSVIRNKIKALENKNEILNFICSDDFYFFYEEGKEKVVLELFYEKLINFD